MADLIKVRGFNVVSPNCKEFIQNKVRELGSLAAVASYYRTKGNGKDQFDTVSKYALAVAAKLYKK